VFLTGIIALCGAKQLERAKGKARVRAIKKTAREIHRALLESEVVSVRDAVAAYLDRNAQLLPLLPPDESAFHIQDGGVLVVADGLLARLAGQGATRPIREGSFVFQELAIALDPETRQCLFLSTETGELLRSVRLPREFDFAWLVRKQRPELYARIDAQAMAERERLEAIWCPARLMFVFRLLPRSKLAAYAVARAVAAHRAPEASAPQGGMRMARSGGGGDPLRFSAIARETNGVSLTLERPEGDTNALALMASPVLLPSPQWTLLATNLVPATNTLTWVDTDGLPTRFYRLCTMNADVDCDGLPDWWEALYEFDLAGTDDSAADPDGDTAGNLLEYQYGTDPTDTQSHPLIADTTIDPDSGFYESSVVVTVETATAEALIYYTTDGSAPSPENGLVSATNTLVLTLTNTTPLRVMAACPGKLPTDVDTRTYIFPATVSQQTRPEGCPETWGTDRAETPAEYGLGSLSSNGVAALEAIPTLSVVMEPANLFGPTGIYDKEGGEGYEVAANAELIHPEGREGFRVDCGIKPHARYLEHHMDGAGRQVVNLKRSFRLVFKDEYGPGKLQYPVFESAANQDGLPQYDSLVLRGGAQQSYGGSHQLHAEWTSYARDQFGRDTQSALCGDGPRGTYVHLYLNGLYWGLYNLAERLDADLMAERYGGDDDEWFVGRQHEAIDGTSAAWSNLFAKCGDGPLTAADCATVDRTNFCDYVLAWWYTGGGDWEDGEWCKNYSVSQNTVSNGPIRFFCWDMELSWLSTTLSTNGAWVKPSFLDPAVDATPGHPIACIFRGLWNDSDFRTLFADRLYKHGFNGGAFTTAKAQARWMRICDFIDDAMLGEISRWGHTALVYDEYGNPTPASISRDDWYLARDYPFRLMDGNAERLVLACREAELHGAALYPAFDPPEVDVQGTTLTLSSGTGTIYYAWGADPRAPGGSVSAQAVEYTGALSATNQAPLYSRVLAGTNWSALAEYVYTLTPPVVISELMVNPDGDDSTNEWLEIANLGDESVDLDGWAFVDGIGYTFNGETILQPGEHLVVARDVDTFSSQHPGVRHVGPYSGALSNDGEPVELVDAGDNCASWVEYDMTTGQVDGEGFSFVPLSGGECRVSAFPGGSPGSEDVFVRDLSDSPPAVSAGPRWNVTQGDTIPLVGRAWDDAYAGAALTYVWTATAGTLANANSRIAQVTLPSCGVSTLTLCATDASGGVTATTTANVSGGGPTAVNGNGGNTQGNGGNQSGAQPGYDDFDPSGSEKPIDIEITDLIPYNDDNDNTNAVADLGESGTVANENDLVKLTWTCIRYAPGTIHLSIEQGASKVKRWTSPTKGTEATNVVWNVNDPGFESTYTCYVEGIERSSVPHDVVFKVTYVTADDVSTDTVSTCVGYVDMDADFNRDGAVDIGDGDDSEEYEKPGLVLDVNATNRVMLVLKGQLDGVTDGKVRLKVFEGDGISVWETQTGGAAPLLDSEDTNKLEHTWDISSSCPLGSFTQTLYVAGTNLSKSAGDANLRFEYCKVYGSSLTPDAKDETRVTKAAIDLDVDSNNDGYVDYGNDGEDEYETYAPGVVVCKDRKGDGEDLDHLVELKPRSQPFNLRGGILTIKATSHGDRVKIWTDTNKTEEIDLPAEFDLAETERPTSLWIDGVATGDVALALSYHRGSTTNTLLRDEVALHVTDTVSWSPAGNLVYTWEPCTWPDTVDGWVATTAVQAVDLALRDQGWDVTRFIDDQAHDNATGTCSFVNFRNLRNAGVLVTHSHGNVGYVAGVYVQDRAAALNWTGGEPGTLRMNSRYWGATVAIAQSLWLTNNWKSIRNERESVTVLLACHSAQGGTNASALAYAGGRARFGHTGGHTDAQQEADMERLFKRMNGSLDSALKRTAGEAYGAGGYNSDFKLHGNDWTTLNPAVRSAFPDGVAGNRKGSGCILFDTYMDDSVPAHSAVTNVSGSISGLRWIDNGSGRIGITFEFDKTGGGAQEVKARADKCRNKKPVSGCDNRKLSGDGATYGQDYLLSF